MNELSILTDYDKIVIKYDKISNVFDLILMKLFSFWYFDAIVPILWSGIKMKNSLRYSKIQPARQVYNENTLIFFEIRSLRSAVTWTYEQH